MRDVRKQLIEVTLPLDAINKACARGKSTRPGDVLREFLKFANRVDLTLMREQTR